VLFQSAAASYGAAAVAVVLSGTGEDGAEGASAVKRAGGTVIVQDQATAAYFGMPGAAIETGDVDFILPLDEIAPVLVRLVSPTIGPEAGQ
jgi:two-component system chemotaxis response regulator CheB